MANLSAFTQEAPHRRYPRAVQIAGAAGCVALAATVPSGSLWSAVGILLLGLVYLLWRVRHPTI